MHYIIIGGALRSDAVALGDCTPQFGISAAMVLGGCIPQFEIFVAGKLQSAKFDPCVLLENLFMILSPHCNFNLSAFRTFSNQTELRRFGPFGSDNCEHFDLRRQKIRWSWKMKTRGLEAGVTHKANPVFDCLPSLPFAHWRVALFLLRQRMLVVVHLLIASARMSRQIDNKAQVFKLCRGYWWWTKHLSVATSKRWEHWERSGLRQEGFVWWNQSQKPIKIFV